MLKRILYIQYTTPAAYPPLLHSSQILADRGWQVLLLGTGAHGADALEFPAHVNIRVRQWKFAQPGLWQKLHFFAFNLWVLWTALIWRPSWIYASGYFVCPVALVLKRLGFDIIYHEHDCPSGRDAGAQKDGPQKYKETVKTLNPEVRNLLQKFLLKTRTRLAQQANLCVLPNEERLESFKQETGRQAKTFCVWNCSSRDEAKIEPRKRDNAFVIFYHGSIVPARLPLFVIDALAALSDEACLKVAGYETIGHSGYVAALKARAAALGISDRLEYLGTIPLRTDLMAQCREAHVGLCLMPIESSDFNEKTMTQASNKPFDYMASGLSLLVTDLPDWSEMFVKPGHARACDSQNANSIAAALTWFAENRKETFTSGERSRERVIMEWNYETQFEPVLEILIGDARDT